MAHKLSNEYKSYLQSESWQIKREFALEKADHRCQICNNTKRLDVHHRTYERFGNEDLSDLTVLCRNCHELYHKSKDKKAAKVKKANKKPRNKKRTKNCISKQTVSRQPKENPKTVALHFVNVINERCKKNNAKPSTLYAQWLSTQKDWPIVLDSFKDYKEHYGFSSPTEAAALSSLWSIACQRLKRFPP